MTTVNEGAPVIPEGIALGPAEMDTIYVNGYEFPRMTGAPMLWAEEMGVARVVDHIDRFGTASRYPYWKSARPLVDLARAATHFTALPLGADER